MAWTKSPPELIEFFDQVIPEGELVEKRKMFGYPCCFANGNMFTGLHQDNMVIRLPETEREQFLKIKDAKVFEPWPGRTMKEYVQVPHHMFKDKKAVSEWVAKGLQYALDLPHKASKKKKG